MTVILFSSSKIRKRGIGNIALSYSSMGDMSLTLNDIPVDQKIYQRIGTSRSINITGNYTGAVGSIQARVINEQGAEVVGWTTIAASPSGGFYSGSLPNVPQGYWYRVQTRASSNNGVLAAGSNRFGVGVVIIMGGQSNMAQLPTMVSTYPLGGKGSIEWRSGAFTRIGNVNDTYPVNTPIATYSTNYTYTGRRGDAYTFIANLVSSGLSVPVLLVEKSASGLPISTWIGSGASWVSFAAEVVAAGGEAEMALWYQGESDASNMAKDTMKINLGIVQSQMMSLVGRNNTNFKFGVISLGPGAYSGSSEGEFGNMRAAHVEFATGTTGAFLAGSAHDLETSDGVHIKGTSFNKLGRRIAKAICSILGVGTSGAGPKITSATRSGAVITVNIEHSGGTSLTDGAGGNGTALTGFQVYDNGVLATISSTQIVGNTILLTLSAVPSGPVTMNYSMVNNPFGTSLAMTPASAVYDNAAYYLSTIGFPLQPKINFAVS